MGSEYGPAQDMFIDDPAWVFTDALKGLNNNDLSIVIHKTACGGSCDAVSVARFFANDTTGKKSVHFIIGTDGTVVQVVHLKDGAGGNCCLEAGHDQFWDSFQGKYGNLNKCTISIEHVDQTNDNSQPMTQAQIDASFALVSWLVQKFNIPLDHIKGHNTLDPLSRARCPGPTYPMSDLLAHIAGGKSVKLDSNGCVMTVPKSFQLESGESGDLCGPWSVVALANSVPPGQTPKATNEQIDVFTDSMVDKIFAPNFDHVSFQGVIPQDMINIMNYVRDTTGLIHYWVIDPKNIPLAVAAGYPCLFSLPEGHIKAWDRNSKSWVQAYTWNLPNAYHVLPVTGFDNNHNWICPDQLNNSYQGYWPPTYQESQIVGSISWACIMQVVGPDKAKPWLATIPSGDPASWPAGFNAQLFASAGASPPPTPPPAPATVDPKRQAFNAEWTAIVPGISSTSGIANAAFQTYWSANFAGPATSKEFSLLGKDGKNYIAQTVLMGVWLWDGSGAHYYPYKAG